MLQRIQSVWLFLASLSLFCLFIFPYLQLLNVGDTAKEIKITGVYESINGQLVQTEAFLLLTIVTVILALVPFLLIFYYKNRKKQITACYISMVLIITHYYWMVRTARGVIGDIELQVSDFGIGAILPSVAMFFTLLAIKGIRRDDKLVKSADRLR